MSSEIATSLAGPEARALDRAHQHRRAPPRWCRTPATSRLRRPRRRACPPPPSARRRRGRSRRSSPARRRRSHAPTGITIRSWMSMRRPACAPPPKIWISGSGSETGASPARCRHSGSPRAAAAACATASDTATVALPPSVALFGVPSSAISARVDAGLVERVAAGERARRSGRRRWRSPARRRSRRSARRRRAGRWPRASRATRRPARSRARTAPPASVTSASTVGRPRESQTRRRADAGRWSVVHRSRRPFAAPARGDRGEPSTGSQQQRRGRSARTASRSASPVRYSTGDLPSMRAEQQAGQQRGGPRLERRPRLPADVRAVGVDQRLERRRGSARARPAATRPSAAGG